MRRFWFGLMSVLVGFGLPMFGSRAEAYTYTASATGHSTDLSSPRDGVGDSAGPAGDLINLILNANDTNSQAIMDRRGVFEIDMSTAYEHSFLGAFLQFDIVSQGSAAPVNIYLFSGDGVVGLDDYARTENIAFSGLLFGDEQQIDITSEVVSMLGDGQSQIGVLIAMTQEDQSLVIDNVDGRGIDPSISTKVPEPTSLLLLGLLGLGVARRRSV